MSTRTPSSSSSRLMLTIGLCFLVALMEGLDLQAAGIAAGGIAQAFALDKMQMGWIFSAGILGLLPGALVGGMLADRYVVSVFFDWPSCAVWFVLTGNGDCLGFPLTGLCAADDRCRAGGGVAESYRPDV